jgi:hypothetical protein
MTPRMTWRGGIPLAIAAAIIAACGSSSTGTDNTGNNGNNGNSANNSCTLTLSGAQTGTPVCAVQNAVLEKGENYTAFSFSDSGPSQLSANVKIPGPAVNGTYQFADVAIGTVTITNGGSTWYAESRNTGLMSLSVTSVSQVNTTPVLTEYQTHGTFTATLVPLAGTAATGNVMLSLTY